MLADRLHLAALHLMRGIRQADRRLPAGPARLSALSVLLSGPKTLGQLAEAEQVSAPTMTRIAAALVAQGLAERRPDRHDRRSSTLRVTPAGRALIETGRRARRQRLEAALQRLDPADVAALRGAIEALERLAALAAGL